MPPRCPPIGLAVLSLLATVAFGAGEAAATPLLGVGAELGHESGRGTVSLHWAPVTLFAWERNYAIGAHYEWKFARWRLGLGGAYVARTESHVGTHENFLVNIGYEFRGLHLRLQHISHASAFGYRRDRPNGGLNILLVEIPLDPAPTATTRRLSRP